MAQVEREVFPVDVLFVGAGPASLSGALHLANLITQHNEEIGSGKKDGKKLDEVMIAVLEKGPQVGAHMLSGAVLDPRALLELMPDYREQGCPIECDVAKEAVYLLKENGKLKFPFLPPTLKNHGAHIISLNKFAAWLAEKAEATGMVNIFAEFAGQEVLYEDSRVIGVRTGDKGVDKDGNPKSNFEPGMDIHAGITMLGEGPRGSLTKHLVPKLELDADSNPQIYGTGVKEIWEVPAGRIARGDVIHTAGYPLTGTRYGGSWIYAMSDTLLSVGFVSALDYGDPHFDPHGVFQKFKTHPFISSILKDGKMLTYGAKAVSEGGYFSMPRLYADGVMLIGESGGFLNIARLKGIHLSMKSGMMAAETAFDALLSGDFSATSLKAYQDRFEASWAKQELWKNRNFRQSFIDRSFFKGMIKAGIQMYTGGGPKSRTRITADYRHMKKVAEVPETQRFKKIKTDDTLTFEKLKDVFYSGTKHEENQPCHLVVLPEDVADICNTRCKEEYGNPCQNFCPANVYEMVDEEGQGSTRLRINFSNCVHCKTCDIADPYQVINWIPPQGGEGPIYTNM